MGVIISDTHISAAASLLLLPCQPATDIQRNLISGADRTPMLVIERTIAMQIQRDQNWILNYVAGHERGIVDYTGRMWYQHPDHMHARHAFHRGYHQ